MKESFTISTDSIELHKIHGKFAKILKTQSEALMGPTFCPVVISRLTKLLNKVRAINEQSKFSITHNQIFVEKVSKHIPEVVELLGRNFLNRSIVILQEQITNVLSCFNAGVEKASSLAEAKIRLMKIVSQLKQLVPKVLSASCSKASPVIFSSIEQALHSIGADLESDQDEAMRMMTSDYPDLVRLISDAESFCKHVGAAHTFIATGLSLENSLRKMRAVTATVCAPLRSHEVYLKQKKPKIMKVDWMDSSFTGIQLLLDNYQETRKEEFVANFNEAMKKAFVLSPPLTSIQEILQVVVTIKPPSDLKTKLFAKCTRLFDSVCLALQKYQQLPPKVVMSDPAMGEFQYAVDRLVSDIGTFAKARKKPQGWTAERSKILLHKFEEFFDISRYVIKGAEFAERANELLGRRTVEMDISDFRMLTVDAHFVVVRPDAGNSNLIGALRAINSSSEAIDALKEHGIDMTDADMAMILHPPSFHRKFMKIRAIIHKFERELFNMSTRSFGEFPEMKTGATILSSFTEFDHSLYDLLLHMHLIPLDILNLRMVSMLLYQQDFPLVNDDSVEVILNELSSVFDYYALLSRLDSMGALSLPNVVELTYLATCCEALADSEPKFKELSDYFMGLDIFNLNCEELTGKLSQLYQIVSAEVEGWNCHSLLTGMGQYTKDVYAIAELLKKHTVDPTLNKLMAHLSSFLANLNRVSPKATYLCETQTRMSVLRQMFLQFCEENPSLRDQMSVDRFLELIDIFGKIRESFEYRHTLKRVVSFIERKQTSDDVSSREPSTIESEASDREKVTDTDEVFKEFKFTKDDINSWEPFAAKFLKSSFRSPKLVSQVELLSPTVVYRHFKDLVVKYCDMWSLEASFASELHDAFDRMLEANPPTTKDELREFFMSNYHRYEQFAEHATSLLDSHLELISKALSKFAPTGRRGIRENFVPHPNAPHIAEVNRGLQSVAMRISSTDFSWYPELIGLYHQLCPLLEDMVTSADGSHPSSLFRRLCRKAYLCFLCSRCFNVFKYPRINYEPDMASLRALITDFMGRPSLENDGTVVMKHQIDEIMKSAVGCDTVILQSSLAIVRQACSLINTKALVQMVEEDFFSFTAFFAAMPSNVSSFEKLVSSKLFEEANNTRNVMFSSISSDYSDGIGRQCIVALHRFQSELNCAPFPVDKSSVFTSMNAIRTLQALSDVSTTFECLDTFTAKDDDSNLVSSSRVLRLRILLYSLESRIRRMARISKRRFHELFVQFSAVMEALAEIPERFGYMDGNQFAFSSFWESWKRFCSLYKPISIQKYWDTFRQITNAIISAFRSSVSDSKLQADIIALEKLVGAYNITHDPSLVFTLRLSFLYFEYQVQRYIPTNTGCYLPFAKLQDAISLLLDFNEMCLLIPGITKRVNLLYPDQDVIENPKAYILEETTPEMEVVGSEEKPELSEQLSFADQTALAETVQDYLDANQRIGDELAELPVIKDEIKCLRPMISHTNERNTHLYEANKIMYDFLTTLCSSSNTSKEESGKCDAQSISQRSDEYQNRVRDRESAGKAAEDRAVGLLGSIVEIEKANARIEADIEASRMKIYEEREEVSIRSVVQAIDRMEASFRETPSRTVLAHPEEDSNLQFPPVYVTSECSRKATEEIAQVRDYYTTQLEEMRENSEKKEISNDEKRQLLQSLIQLIDS